MTRAQGPITVLMATQNGADFLAEQLTSLADQTLLPARLIVSDDGSVDNTAAIVQHFAERAPFATRLVDGPRKGLAGNVFALLQSAPKGPLAFADQDDVWLPRKLERAHAFLKGSGDIPTLYAAGRIFTDAQLRPKGRSADLRRAPGFENALVQNIAAGNTIVLNAAAAQLARAASVDGTAMPAFHDWWLYQLISGVGGAVIYDPTHVILYRGHRTNVLGPNAGVLARFRRLAKLADGTYGRWIGSQAGALSASSHRLAPQSRALLKQFLGETNARSLRLARMGLYRQGKLETLLLNGAARLGRV